MKDSTAIVILFALLFIIPIVVINNMLLNSIGATLKDSIECNNTKYVDYGIATIKGKTYFVTYTKEDVLLFKNNECK